MFVTTLHRAAVFAALGFSVAILTACGGGGGMAAPSMGSTGGSGGMSPSSCSAATCGAALMTLTDAKGDFLSYIVTLTSLQLQTANGTVVETLPGATKVDFTQLVDLSEVISAGQIPPAEYVSAKLTLDFSSASITADDGTGKPLSLKPLDSTGANLTSTVSVTVQLDNAHHLVITPGNTGRLAFDFNLAASNTVDMTADTVTVSPTLVATVVPSDTKPIRVRGALVSGDTANNDFVLNVQPFHDHGGTAGQVTVNVASTTTYQINGTAYVGTPGLTALAALPANTMVAAFGTINTGNKTLTATGVLAGTSLENPSADLITGTVIARNQNALTVRGATLIHRDGDFDFQMNDTTVNVASTTGVTEEGQTGTFTIANISVGQHISAFGSANSSAGTTVMDATAGQVRLDLTPAWGTITSMGTGTLTLNLQSLSGMAPAVFNFAGTGSSTAADAKATAYVINTGTLAQTALTLNVPARVIGFVTPFGSAPPDFTAATLVNYSAVTNNLLVTWGAMGSTTAFSGLTPASTSLQLSLTNVGTAHFITVGPQRVDLTTLSAPPAISPDTTGPDIFTIGHEGRFRADNFMSFADFITALSQDLTGSTAVIAVAAAGHYDSTQNTFTANRIAVSLSN